MVGKESAGAVDGIGDSRSDGLVDGNGSGVAVMGSAGLIGLSTLSVSVFELAVAVAISSDDLVLLQSVMTLLVAVAIAVTVETAAPMNGCVVHCS
jgi:hypothetical protein